MFKLDNLIEKLCPDGVKFEELKEICMVSIGEFVHKNKQREDAKYPVFNGGISNTGFYDEYNNEGNKILISARGANAGFINKIESRYWAGNSCYSIEVKDKSSINWLYVYYYLKNNEKNLLGQQQTGSIPAISKKQIESFKIAVPPLEVQCEIVHILDDFTLLSAELSAELKARKNQYNYYLEKLLCNDKNAKIYKLKELCVFFNGDRGKNYPKVSEMVNKGVPFVNAGDVNRVIDYKNCNKITLEKYNSMNGAKLRKNDILYCLRGSTGKNGIYELDEGTVASSLVAIRVNSIINYKYLYYLLNSSLERRQRYKSDTGAAQPNLSVQSISNYEFPVPNMEEQNKIVNILDKFEKLCNDISEGLPAEIEARQKQYEYYRDKLLTFKELKVNE